MSTSLVLAVTAGAFGGTGHWQCTNGLYSDVVCWDGDFPGDLGDVAVVDWDNFGTAYTLDMDLDVNVGSVNVESPDARFLIDDNVLNFAVSLNVLPGAVVDLRNGSIVGDVGIITNGGDLIVRGTSLIDLQAFDNNNFNLFDGGGSLMEDFTTVPIQVYNWTIRPQEEFRAIAASGIIVLMLTVFGLNLVAVLIRERFRKTY